MATAGVTLRTTHEQARTWADEFLTPFFDIGGDRPGSTDSITATYGHIESAPTHYPAPTHYGACREQALFLRRRGLRWSHDGTDFVRDADSGDVFRIGDDGVVARYRTDEPYFVRDAARLVRECAVDRLVQGGAIRLHAACAAVNGRGILIVGGAGAGKSSTLAQLLAAGAHFVANDRALMLPGPSGPVVLGLPVAVRWSPAQLNYFPAGPEFMADYDRISMLKRSDEAAGFRKFELTTRELAAVTDRLLTPEVPLAAVVIADRDRSDRSSLQTVDARTATAALRDVILADDPAFPAFFRRHRKPVGIPAAEIPTDTVRVFRVCGSYLDPFAVDQLAETVAQSH